MESNTEQLCAYIVSLKFHGFLAEVSLLSGYVDEVVDQEYFCIPARQQITFSEL